MALTLAFRILLELTNQVNNNDWIVAVVLGRLLGGIVARLVEQEGRHVGREHGGVDDQEKDDPVPKGFEGWVMNHCPFVDPWRGLEPVLGTDLVAYGQDLQGIQKSSKWLWQQGSLFSFALARP